MWTSVRNLTDNEFFSSQRFSDYLRATVPPRRRCARGPAGFGPESRRRRDDPEHGRAVLDEVPGGGGAPLRPGHAPTDVRTGH